ncbi:MAG: GTP-binding protein, partial [Calditrichia bacterium]|nr:GTP-binding protein [Calditrichia bacterium]
MKSVKTEQIRNIMTGAHGGSGKTSLVEAMLFSMGACNRIGAIDQGNTVSDYNEDEIERQISINASLLHGEWKNHKINIIDTPGFMDFFGDVVSSTTVIDTMLILVSAANGVEVGTEQVWNLAEKNNKPRIIVINKLDRENVNFENVFNALKEDYGNHVVMTQFPVEVGPNFFKIVDVIKNKVYAYNHDKSGKFTEEEIPADLQAKAEEIRNELIESVAESDDELMEKYFENGELTPDEFSKGLKTAIANCQLFPVICTSATHNVGVHGLLDFITNNTPAPNELPPIKDVDGNEIEATENGGAVAFAFRTVSEAHMGELQFTRVYRGVLESGKDLKNATQNNNERIGQMYILNGKGKTQVDKLVAGDIGALVKLKNTHTSDTLTEKGKEVVLPKIDFPAPIIRTAVNPKNKGDEDKIGAGLNTLHEEDPTFIINFDG